MKTIYDPVKLGTLQLKNRCIRSAVFETGAANLNGEITPYLSSLYEELVKGDVALIITGMMGVAPNSCITKGMVKIYRDSFVERFSQVADMVHQGGAKIIVQLGHNGTKARDIEEGDCALGPSDSAPDAARPAKAMSKEYIKYLVSQYGDSALKCKQAGADGVELHGGHGYLLSEFLSPYFNKRTDEYGGSLENRARIIFEIYDDIRAKTGPGYPIFIKINSADFTTPGLTAEEAMTLCKELSKKGFDAIEVSGGLAVDAVSSPVRMIGLDSAKEAYFADFALKAAEAVPSTPILSVGGYRSEQMISKYLNLGNIAAICIGRPLVSEPHLLSRWKSGDGRRARCISCNKCFATRKLACMIKWPDAA